jgi:hypothetical protein
MGMVSEANAGEQARSAITVAEAPPAESSETQGLQNEQRSEFWLGHFALALAFLSFGLALGLLTGFSAAQGVSLTLLSGVFTFVAGGLLTFSGFSSPTRGLASKWKIDPVRLGVSLFAFSWGLILGTPLGVWERCNPRFQSQLLGETLDRSPCAEASSMAVAKNDPPESQGERPRPPASTGAPQAGTEASACAKVQHILYKLLGDDDKPASERLNGLDALIESCVFSKECRAAYDDLHAAVTGQQPDYALRPKLTALTTACKLTGGGP